MFLLTRIQLLTPSGAASAEHLRCLELLRLVAKGRMKVTWLVLIV